MDFEISLQQTESASIGKSFSSNDKSMMLMLPPNPCAPPKYYFLWKWQMSLNDSGSYFFKSSGNIFSLQLYSQAETPELIISIVKAFEINLKLVRYSSLGWPSKAFCSSKNTYKNPGVPQSNQFIILPFSFLQYSQHSISFCSFSRNQCLSWAQQAKYMPHSQVQVSDIQKAKVFLLGLRFAQNYLMSLCCLLARSRQQFLFLSWLIVWSSAMWLECMMFSVSSETILPYEKKLKQNVLYFASRMRVQVQPPTPLQAEVSSQLLALMEAMAVRVGSSEPVINS